MLHLTPSIRILSILAITVYGLVESIPAYLMPVYVLKAGMDDSVAAYTLSAFALGTLLSSYPIGRLSDHFGRQQVIVGAASLCALLTLAFPFLVQTPTAFLVTVVLWGGCVIALYATSLAMIGDQFDGKSLIYANAAFGLLYAVASVIGPILNGLTMQWRQPHGLMYGVGAILIVIPAAYWLQNSETTR